jgi:hypothetical protein
VEIQVLAVLLLRRRGGNKKFAYRHTFISFKNIFIDFCFEVEYFPIPSRQLKKYILIPGINI